MTRVQAVLLFQSLLGPLQTVRLAARRRITERPFGLKAKIILLIIINVAGVLLLSGYVDYKFTQKAQIDLYIDRNFYFAKQIEIGIPDEGIRRHLSSIREEMNDWLMSRRSLVEIDFFLFNQRGWETILSDSKMDTPFAALKLNKSQIERLKKDKHLSTLIEEEGNTWLEVIVPYHEGKRIAGGIRVISTLDEVQSYLAGKKERALILTVSSILAIIITVTLLFGRLVGNPIQELVGAMSRAQKGELDASARVRSRDELGELGKHFNQMLRTIRETHDQNVELLSRVSRFNEELTHKVEEATSELAARNEELRMLNEALFESQRQLSQSEKLAALGQVTATMAHQIGTPLNSISGYIQLMLQERDLHPTARDRLKIIESQLDRLADSVKTLLSFTRQPKPPMKPLDVNTVLEELIHLSQPWVHARKVEIRTSLDGHLAPVLGDSTQLQTLFLNLMTNAIDAMPEGGVLTIETHPFSVPSSSANGQWVRICISDTGIGITEEMKKRIFDPFFTTKKIGEGTGLGLAICGKITKEHGGKLEVESEVGKGSTFSVSIPFFEGTTPYEQ
jgi:two-component system, NtrC family, sensor kinase